MTPSLKAAQAELRRRLGRIDDMHSRALANLPDDHSWHELDALEIERCDMAKEAHNDFKAAEAEWKAYVAQHSEEAEVESDEAADRGDWEFHREHDQ